VIFIAYIGLNLWPGILFANHIESGNITIHADQQLGDELEIALRDIEASVSTSELYDPILKHDIFFGYRNKMFSALQIKPALTYNRNWPPYFSQIVTFRQPHFQANTLSHPEHKEDVVNLRQILSHEIVHTLINSHLGMRQGHQSPLWKIEGYCDYVAASTSTFADPSYELQASVKRILNKDLSWMMDDQGNYTQMQYGHKQMSSIRNEQGVEWPTCYYISRVLWEYHLNVKGLSFDEVMNPEITDHSTLTELIAAYKSKTLDESKQNPELDPTVKTPVESGKVQGTAGQL
jgi:hypothetical protein